LVGSIGRWLAQSAGPKVLVGVIASAVIIISLLTWRWQAEKDNAADAEAQADAMSAALAGAEQTITEQRADIKALDQAIADQKAREQAARERAAEAEQRLQSLEDSNAQVRDWSDSAVPDGVRGWLHDHADSD